MFHNVRDSISHQGETRLMTSVRRAASQTEQSQHLQNKHYFYTTIITLLCYIEKEPAENHLFGTPAYLSINQSDKLIQPQCVQMNEELQITK